MITHFQIVPPHAGLRQFIERIFIIESSGKFPSDDLKLIVPNACSKLIIPYRNGVVGKTNEWDHTTKENTITFIGISDIPAIVDHQHDTPSGNITIEFSPLGAYRFFDFSRDSTKNRIHDYSDIAPKEAGELQEQLANTPLPANKLAIVERFLFNRFVKRDADPLLDYCVQQIYASKGRLPLKELERYTGYSARWLNMKFSEKVGLSPKNLASVVRFQQYYQSLSSNAEQFFLEKEFYHYYYDQSHFIRDFRRFTGHIPTSFLKSTNDYDRYFYKG